MQKVTDGFKPMVKRSSSSPLKVAEVILNAILSNDLGIRYLAGNDAFSLIENRKKFSDEEFENWIKEAYYNKKDLLDRKEFL